MLASLFLSLVHCTLLSVAAPLSSVKPRQNPDPAAAGGADGGWKELPQAADAYLFSDWVVAGSTIPVYISNPRDQFGLKRAVIVLPGRNRDCWFYYNTMNNALIQASGENNGVSQDTVSVMAPCFLTEADRNSGSAKDSNLQWGTTTWISGHQSVNAETAFGTDTSVSSYQVLDELVAYYMNQTNYPALEAVVVAGHSAGGQMAQRYAALRQTTDNDNRLQFWVANAGSFLWMTPDRPHPDANCPTFDRYKYGLADGFIKYASTDAQSIGREGIQARYRGRTVHYAQGLADDGNGDTRCQAMTQGSTHLERGQNYQAMLQAMSGGMPSTHTFDYIEGVSHVNEGMMYSEQGKEKLFRFLPTSS